MEIREKVKECLEESGLIVLENGDIEITDSVNYIYAVLALEEAFDIEFAENYLNDDFMKSIDQLTDIIQLISQKSKTEGGY